MWSTLMEDLWNTAERLPLRHQTKEDVDRQVLECLLVIINLRTMRSCMQTRASTVISLSRPRDAEGEVIEPTSRWTLESEAYR